MPYVKLLSEQPLQDLVSVTVPTDHALDRTFSPNKHQDKTEAREFPHTFSSVAIEWWVCLGLRIGPTSLGNYFRGMVFVWNTLSNTHSVLGTLSSLLIPFQSDSGCSSEPCYHFFLHFTSFFTFMLQQKLPFSLGCATILAFSTPWGSIRRKQKREERIWTSVIGALILWCWCY